MRKTCATHHALKATDKGDRYDWCYQKPCCLLDQIKTTYVQDTVVLVQPHLQENRKSVPWFSILPHRSICLLRDGWMIMVIDNGCALYGCIHESWWVCKSVILCMVSLQFNRIRLSKTKALDLQWLMLSIIKQLNLFKHVHTDY